MTALNIVDKQKLMKPQALPFKDMHTWIIAAIYLGALAVHYTIYRVSISGEPSIQEMVAIASNFIRTFIPGASSYERLNHPFYVSYLQLATSIIFSVPTSFILFRATVRHTVQQRANTAEKLFDLRLRSAIFLIVGFIVLFLPPSELGEVFQSGHFGFLAPVRYSAVSVAIGFFLGFMFFRQARGEL